MIVFSIALIIITLVNVFEARKSVLLREVIYNVEESQQSSKIDHAASSQLEKLRQYHIVIRAGYLSASILLIVAVAILYIQHAKLEKTVRDTEAGYKLRFDIETQKAQQKINDANARLQMASEAIKKRNAELSEFSYSISHDLRAPLRAINGFSGILMEEHAGHLDEEGKRALMAIRQNSSRMDELIDDLLDLARVGSMTVNKQWINTQEMVKQVLANHAVKPGTKIKISSLEDVNADPSMLRQVWDILISNAIKFSSRKEKPEIVIGHKKLDNQQVFWVKDDGVGFDPTYTEKLFRLFSRLHTKKEFEGTGAGLAIAKKIIEAHGGNIWAEAVLHEGATVYFSLPPLPRTEEHVMNNILKN